MRHPELPLSAFFTAALVLIPLPLHWRAQNTATLAIIFWLFVVNIIYGIDSVMWAGNVANSAPVWCDISTKIVVGAFFALPLTMLCVCKHLESVSSTCEGYDRRDRRRTIFESIMCFGLPLVFMVLHSIVQDHRFDIYEDVGCQAVVYISIPAILIVWFPRLLFSVIALIYAAMALHHFMLRRLTFSAHLKTSKSALTTKIYLSVISMAITEIVWGAAFTIFDLYNSVAMGLHPWTTWADVHSNFSRVDQYPRVYMLPHSSRTMMISWWAMPTSSIIFFVFFGFGEEARKDYARIWTWFRTKVLRRPAMPSPSLNFSIKGSSNSHRLYLVNLRNSNGDHKPPSKTTTTFISNPSISALAPSSPQKEEVEFDTQTICPSSLCDQSIGFPFPTSPSHHISIPDNLESSLPSASTTCNFPFPEPVNGATDLELPSSNPTYWHSPFTLPSIYPVSRLVPSSRQLMTQGIHVTIHRQRSVDEIV